MPGLPDTIRKYLSQASCLISKVCSPATRFLSIIRSLVSLLCPSIFSPNSHNISKGKAFLSTGFSNKTLLQIGGCLCFSIPCTWASECWVPSDVNDLAGRQAGKQAGSASLVPAPTCFPSSSLRWPLAKQIWWKPSGRRSGPTGVPEPHG